MEQRLTIIIADDHPMFRNALTGSIEAQHPGALLLECEDIQSLQGCVEDQAQVSLVLLDLHMPGAHGFSGLIHLNAHHPEIPVMIISAHETDDVIHRAMEHGAAGFLPKSSSLTAIANAIEQVLAGELWLPDGYDAEAAGDCSKELEIANILASLTPQQFRVAGFLAQGLLNKQIAYELSVTEATVKAHVTEIYRKLGVNSRTQAVLAIGQLDVSPPTQL